MPGPRMRDVDEAEEIEQRLLADFASDYAGNDECRSIIESLLARVRRSGGANRYKQQLRDACNVLDTIREACWMNWLPSDKQRSDKRYMPRTLWAWPDDGALIECPKEWCGEKSPADLDDLDKAMAEYLNRPWMRHDTIDVSVINALIFTELALYAEEVKSGRPFGMINWSNFFSGGNPLKQLGFSLVGRLIRFLMAWVMLPAIALALVAYGYETAAGVTISIWALYVLYRIISIPARFRLRKARQKAAEKATEILTAMEKAWQAARGRTINPSRLRELVLAAEERGARFRPAVLHTLIDRAIQRDPTALTRPSC